MKMKLADVLKAITPLPHMAVPTPPGADAEFSRIMGDDLELGGTWDTAIETKGVADTPLPQKMNAAYWAHAANTLPALVDAARLQNGLLALAIDTIKTHMPVKGTPQPGSPLDRMERCVAAADKLLAAAEEVEVLP